MMMPTPEELARQTGWPVEEWRHVRDVLHHDWWHLHRQVAEIAGFTGASVAEVADLLAPAIPPPTFGDELGIHRAPP